MTSLLLWLVLAQTSGPSSVLLVTLDTFRGDHIGPETPHLSRLAAEGVTFTRARSPTPLTLPAHASLLTGLYPPEHGVRDNGNFVLGDTQTTLAEVLRDEGYETSAFVGSFILDRRFGLAQGFDVYDDNVQSDVASLESPEAERPGDAVVSAFEQWLAGREAEKPFFAWVHLYDPHAPYRPPAPFPASYAGEVAFTDALVGRLLGLVPSSTLVVVVGDHGEGLGEHEETTHALLIYNSTLHVPLILAGGAGAAGAPLPRGRAVASLVRTIDLPATLLDYLGIARTLGRGESLRSMVEGADEDRDAYSESLYGSYHFGFSPLYGIETHRFRFIDAPRRELYDLSADPNETRDRLQEMRPTSRELLLRLDEFRKSLSRGEADAARLDAETRTRLESLGYVTSSPTAANLRDPKDEIEIYDRIQLALARRGRGQCREAAESLSRLISEVDYVVPVAYETLGACLLDLGELDRARELLAQAVEHGVDSTRVHTGLGVVQLRVGNLDAAERELRAALTLDPLNVIAHYHLGSVQRAKGLNSEALTSYRDAIGLNPGYVFAWNGLGMTLARTGENDGALAAFREVVALQPEEPRGHFNLAVQLERVGRRQEALETYQHFLEISDEAAFPRERARAREAVRKPVP